MKRIMRIWSAVLVALMLAGTAQAWQPAGWIYVNWPWAYDSTSGDWHWFSADGTQWINAFPPGAGWFLLQSSSIAHGWSFWNGAFAYDGETGAWCWRNTGDTQWVVNMRTSQWSRFGEDTLPAGMVLIPGGTNAGTNPDPELGTYSLTVSTFYMDKHEITKAKWDEVYAWAITNGYGFNNVGSGKATNHPVQTVSWYDAVKWCNARSQKEGRPMAYTVYAAGYKTGQANNVVLFTPTGYHLPTEVEWEYAARGGVTNHRFPWEDTNTIQHARANYNSTNLYFYDTSPTREYHPTYVAVNPPFTSPVGVFAPTRYGLYDMAGNVEEWCFDLTGSNRVIRGGSWGNKSPFCRVGSRLDIGPNVRGYYTGFRTILAPGQ